VISGATKLCCQSFVASDVPLLAKSAENEVCKKNSFEQSSRLESYPIQVWMTFWTRTSRHLGRRLQTLVYQRGFALSQQQSIQLIAHGHISINGRKVSSPSYLAKEEEENIAYSPNSPLTNPEHPITMSITVQQATSLLTKEENSNE
jgi:ribosomal protein S4